MAKQSTAKQERKQDSDVNARAAVVKQKSAAPNLDRLIHERLRLGIISALAANESLTFSDLKNLMNTTDGNLSVHARKLEEAFICFTAAVGEENFSEPDGIHEFFRKTSLRLVKVKVRGVNELFRLLDKRFGNRGMRVAKRRHRDANQCQ